MTHQPGDDVPATFTPLLERVSARPRGMILLAVGLGLAKWQIWDPLHAYETGQAEVTIYSAVQFLAVMLPCLGIAYLLFGDRVDTYMKQEQIDPCRPTVRMMAWVLPIVVVAFAVHTWIKIRLSETGYR